MNGWNSCRPKFPEIPPGSESNNDWTIKAIVCMENLSLLMKLEQFTWVFLVVNYILFFIASHHSGCNWFWYFTIWVHYFEGFPSTKSSHLYRREYNEPGQGSLYYQPKQCTSMVKSLKTSCIVWFPQYGKFNDTCWNPNNPCVDLLIGKGPFLEAKQRTNGFQEEKDCTTQDRHFWV